MWRDSSRGQVTLVRRQLRPVSLYEEGSQHTMQQPCHVSGRYVSQQQSQQKGI